MDEIVWKICELLVIIGMDDMYLMYTYNEIYNFILIETRDHCSNTIKMILPTLENKMIEKIFNSFNYQLKFLQQYKVLLLQQSMYNILFVEARCFNFQKNTQ